MKIEDVKEKIAKMKKYHYSIDWGCPLCGNFGEEEEYCRFDRRKLVKHKQKWESDIEKACNLLIDEILKLLE